MVGTDAPARGIERYLADGSVGNFVPVHHLSRGVSVVAVICERSRRTNRVGGSKMSSSPWVVPA